MPSIKPKSNQIQEKVTKFDDVEITHPTRVDGGKTKARIELVSTIRKPTETRIDRTFRGLCRQPDEVVREGKEVTRKMEKIKTVLVAINAKYIRYGAEKVRKKGDSPLSKNQR